MKNKKYDVVGGIMDWESGEMQTIEEVVELFTALRDQGTLGHLQGSYGRTYHALQQQGLIE